MITDGTVTDLWFNHESRTIFFVLKRFWSNIKLPATATHDSRIFSPLNGSQKYLFVTLLNISSQRQDVLIGYIFYMSNWSQIPRLWRGILDKIQIKSKIYMAFDRIYMAFDRVYTWHLTVSTWHSIVSTSIRWKPCRYGRMPCRCGRMPCRCGRMPCRYDRMPCKSYF